MAQAQKTPAPAVAVPAVAMPAVAVPAVPTQSATPIVDPATLQAPPGMPAKRAHVWLVSRSLWFVFARGNPLGETPRRDSR